MRLIRNLAIALFFVVFFGAQTAYGFDWRELWSGSEPCEEIDCQTNQEECDYWCYEVWQGSINLTHCVEDSGWCYYSCMCQIPG